MVVAYAWLQEPTLPPDKGYSLSADMQKLAAAVGRYIHEE